MYTFFSRLYHNTLHVLLKFAMVLAYLVVVIMIIMFWWIVIPLYFLTKDSRRFGNVNELVTDFLGV